MFCSNDRPYHRVLVYIDACVVVTQITTESNVQQKLNEIQDTLKARHGAPDVDRLTELIQVSTA